MTSQIVLGGPDFIRWKAQKRFSSWPWRSQLPYCGRFCEEAIWQDTAMASRNWKQPWDESQQKMGICLIVAAVAAKLLQSCLTLCNPIDGNPPGSPVPGILQARTTGVGCHFLLQCMKVKSESEVAQLCLTLSDPTDCSLPGSTVHGILQARVPEWGAIA